MNSDQKEMKRIPKIRTEASSNFDLKEPVFSESNFFFKKNNGLQL